ncbi:MAG: hypothetical protein J7M08_03205 [Planctomycetes bacterium]|nr:hypothetical protein [Planctomycetota bacterium]
MPEKKSSNARRAHCPNCHESFPAYKAGRTYTCPRCGRLVKVRNDRRTVRIVAAVVLVVMLSVLFYYLIQAL